MKKRIIFIFFTIFIITTCLTKEITVKKTNNKNSFDNKKIFVLCYHRFKKRSINDEKRKKWGDIYYLEPTMFEKHIKFLKKNYNIISMKEFIDFLNNRLELPDRSVLITIDDGYKSIYKKAYPIIKKYRVPVTLFLYQNFFPGGKNALSKKEIKEMLKTGLFTIGLSLIHI